MNIKLSRVSKFGLLVFAMLLCSNVKAWTVSQSQFVYNGQHSNDHIGAKVWRSNQIIQASGGLGVGLYGDPDPAAPGSCPTTTNCGAANCWSSWIPSTSPLTQVGVSLPTYYTPKCPNDNWQGFTYFGVSPNIGFGMRTWTGLKPIDSSLAFFMPARQQPNKDIASVYTNIRSVPGVMKPWSATCSGANCDDKVRVALVSDHQVASLSAPSGRQVTQRVRAVFQQQDCVTTSTSPCLVEINFGTLCAGINCSGITVQGGDPAQSGMPYVAGTVGGQGVTSLAPNNSLPIWTSWGSATQSAPFPVTRFQIEISWNQFKNLLAATAQARLGSGSTQNIATMYGSQWGTKTNWVIVESGFGQEVYNANLSSRAHVGGNVQFQRFVAIAH